MSKLLHIHAYERGRQQCSAQIAQNTKKESDVSGILEENNWISRWFSLIISSINLIWNNQGLHLVHITSLVSFKKSELTQTSQKENMNISQPSSIMHRVYHCRESSDCTAEFPTERLNSFKQAHITHLSSYSNFSQKSVQRRGWAAIFSWRPCGSKWRLEGYLLAVS